MFFTAVYSKAERGVAVFIVGGVMPTKGDGLRLTPVVRIRLWATVEHRA
ncbi:hypothetical protein [Bacteroides acidifaciens]|nr:hypothetical protein [Bacteroides acidifaciens]